MKISLIIPAESQPVHVTPLINSAGRIQSSSSTGDSRYRLVSEAFFFVTCVSNCACVQQSPAAPKWFPRRFEQQRASPKVFHYRYL